MIRYILDTDHLTLLKRNHPIVRAKIGSTPPADIFVTIVTIE
jgi:tRNA(fMet)-specific endonuclease VapC